MSWFRGFLPFGFSDLPVMNEYGRCMALKMGWLLCLSVVLAPVFACCAWCLDEYPGFSLHLIDIILFMTELLILPV